MDRWMRTELHRLIRDVRAAYDRYEFHRATRMLYDFCTVQASSVYLNAAKDRLYCDEPDGPRRRATQTVIHETLTVLTKLLTPILAHTCEEAWGHVPGRDPAEPDEVALARLPEPDGEMLALADEADAATDDLSALAANPDEATPARVWPRLLELRSRALERLEAFRSVVKNSLETEIEFRVGDEAARDLLSTYLVDLEDLTGAGYASVAVVPDVDGVEIEVRDSRETYEKCARSWKRRPDVGSDPDYPDLSARDAATMRLLGQGGGSER